MKIFFTKHYIMSNLKTEFRNLIISEVSSFDSKVQRLKRLGVKITPSSPAKLQKRSTGVINLKNDFLNELAKFKSSKSSIDINLKNHFLNELVKVESGKSRIDNSRGEPLELKTKQDKLDAQLKQVNDLIKQLTAVVVRQKTIPREEFQQMNSIINILMVSLRNIQNAK